MGIRDTMFKFILGTFSALVSKTPCNSKETGHREKQTEICLRHTTITHISATFDLVVFKVRTCLKMAYKSKTAGHRVKQNEI